MNKTQIKELIQTATTQPSKSFGYLVLEVNHRVIGNALRKYRVGKRVKAAAITKALGTTRSYLVHLEKGVNRWSLELIQRYVKITEQIAKEEKRQKKGEAAH